ncbi:hypothetical protein [Shimia thalassica]|uniref:hypothetical protein n=1 Tax=Shimia thalassica TaxID=1715693 RepID=UPI0026E17A84|nr:hypothetical protein [Shimia thalassica]MDO6480963.1 hypothetical protein [Shimia thalassica]
MLAARLNPRDRAKLYLAVADALEVPRDDFIQTQRDRARAEYALALADGADHINFWAALSLADEITFSTDGQEWRVEAKSVAENYGVTIGTARRALKLAGWVRERSHDVWKSESTARDWWVPEADDGWWHPDE